MEQIGRRIWAIAEGHIPSRSVNEEHALISHEAACFLNATNEVAEVALTLFFTDREPAGPYRVRVPARRTLHLRFNDLTDPEPVPRDTDYATLIASSVPIVVQYTRQDTRHPAIALISTIAFASDC